MMSKNIVIKESNVRKLMSGVKYVAIPDLDGNTTIWIPRDEAVDYLELATPTITENGVYLPETFGAEAIGRVEVNVSMGIGKTIQNAVVQTLDTYVTAFALTPNIIKTDQGWEWQNEYENRKYSTRNSNTAREYLQLADNNIKSIYETLVIPADTTAVELAETTYLTVGDQQVYFKSLDFITSGNQPQFSTTAPSEYDSSIGSVIEEMYKVRRLAVSTSKVQAWISTQTDSNGAMMSLLFGNGNARYTYQENATTHTKKDVYRDPATEKEYGHKVVHSDIGGNDDTITAYKVFNSIDFVDAPEKVYSSLEEAEADTELPIGGIARIIRG